jgi:tetratricopeptide (TPR) repeat protein
VIFIPRTTTATDINAQDRPKLLAIRKTPRMQARKLYVCRHDRLGMRLVNILQSWRFARRAGYSTIACWPTRELNAEKDMSREGHDFSLQRFFDLTQLSVLLEPQGIQFTETTPPQGLTPVTHDTALRGHYPKQFDPAALASLPPVLFVDGFAAGLRFRDEDDNAVRLGCHGLFQLLPWCTQIKEGAEKLRRSMGGDSFVAVHIRRGDFVSVVREMLQKAITRNATEPGPDLKRMLRMLPKKLAPLSSYVAAVERTLPAGSRVLVFSDSAETAKTFSELLPYRVEIISDVATPDLDVNQRALAELIVMSSADCLIGTHSAFSRCAALVSKGDYLNVAPARADSVYALACLEEIAGELLAAHPQLRILCSKAVAAKIGSATRSTPRARTRTRNSSIMATCKRLMRRVIPPRFLASRNSPDVGAIIAALPSELLSEQARQQLADNIARCIGSSQQSLDKEVAKLADLLGRRSPRMLSVTQALLDRRFRSAALAFARAHLNARPYDPWASFGIGLCQEAVGQHALAIESYSQCAQSVPYSDRPYLALSLLAKQRGHKTAEKEWRQLSKAARAGRHVAAADLWPLQVFSCPYPLIRLGSPNDGGYVIADLPHTYDIFCSGGISDNCDFEREAVARFNLPCHAFDPTIDGALLRSFKNIHWHRKAIGFHETEFETNLGAFLKKAQNAFVKLDIESGEYAWLNKCDPSTLQRVKQIVLEIHQPLHLTKLALLAKLAATHVLVHIHGNNAGKAENIGGALVPRLLECTYVRKDFADEKPASNREQFPKSIDRPNIAGKDQYVLSGWPYSA